jgi:hypothetical protein
MTRSFRVKFVNDKDLNECLKVLGDYFPINIYASDDVNRCTDSSVPNMGQSLFFHATKDILVAEQSMPMTLRTDFIRQYLSTCILDPAFLALVNTNEHMLKMMLTDN